MPFYATQPRRVRAPPRRQVPTPAGGSPKLHLSAASSMYRATLDVPAELSIHSLRASFADGGRRLQVEGTMGSCFEYYAHRRVPVCLSPAAAPRIAGHARAGSILTGKPRHGWVELDGGDGWVPEDHLQRLRPARVDTFKTAVELPADALPDSAKQFGELETFEVRIPRIPSAPRSSDRRHGQQYKVVCGERVVLRTAPSLHAEAAGVIYPGDVVRGEEVAPGWLRVADDVWVMIRHPQYGQLLQPIGTAAAPAPQPAPVPTAPVANATKPHHKSVRGLATDTLKSSKTRRAGLVPQADPVLVECPIDAANVQRPEERMEEWDASLDGCFMRSC